MLFASGAIQRQGSTGQRHQRRRQQRRSARARRIDRAQPHAFRLSRRAIRDGRRARLDRLRRRRARARSRSPTSPSSSSTPTRRAPPLAAPALRMLDEQGIPHLIFVNRIDQAHGSHPRPARRAAADERVAADRAPDPDPRRRQGHRLRRSRARARLSLSPRASRPSGCRSPPTSPSARRAERTHMLEQLADHDDELLEQLLMDEPPAPAAIFADLARETGDNLGVSVLFGSATQWLGRAAAAQGAAPRSAAGPPRPRYRLGVEATVLLRVQGVARRHRRAAGARRACSAARSRKAASFAARDKQAARFGTLFSVQGDKTAKLAKRRRRRADRGRQGRRRSRPGNGCRAAICRRRSRSSCRRATARLAIEPADRKDDVKLSGALARLVEEDPSLALEQDEASHELRLKGVNDEHLRTALARIKRRYGVEVAHRAPSIGYRELIRQPVTQRGRHKKQSGGHGQFGDVVIEIRPAAARRRLPLRRQDLAAAPSPSNISPRSSMACATPWPRGRWASRWSTSR